MSRKIKKYDIVMLITKGNKKKLISKHYMGWHLVLSVKKEGIKLFSVSSMNFLEFGLKEFAKKYEVKFYG